jgi:hypothetical protein
LAVDAVVTEEVFPGEIQEETAKLPEPPEDKYKWEHERREVRCSLL